MCVYMLSMHMCRYFSVCVCVSIVCVYEYVCVTMCRDIYVCMCISMYVCMDKYERGPKKIQLSSGGWDPCNTNVPAGIPDMTSTTGSRVGTYSR